MCKKSNDVIKIPAFEIHIQNAMWLDFDTNELTVYDGISTKVLKQVRLSGKKTEEDDNNGKN